jgi:L-seryl-tRNA(Ser) seleniumtransferase
MKEGSAAEKTQVIQEAMRQIPQVDKILSDPRLSEFSSRIDHVYLTQVVRDRVDDFRNRVLNGEKVPLDQLYDSIVREVNGLLDPYFRYAVNALGIVLHTGLGRAPFSAEIIEAMTSVSRGYSRLQIDDEGKRDDRYRKISALLRILTGAEASLIVNNNAGATLLILHALASGKEVVVSRGQLIEIGGAFRIPDVMAQSGAIMREVGTTNRTHLKDYESAVNPATGALLRVHQSNYRIAGFTKEVSLEELVELARKHDILVVDDLGSGALIDLSRYGLPKEPLVQESVRAGADIVCFSGDKLIGGPQCGIIVGRKNLIDRIKKDPLTRALRCDKLTNAALEATLRIFLRSEADLIRDHAVLGLLLRTPRTIKKQADKFCRKLRKSFSDRIDASVRQAVSEIGGGSLSTEQLPTYVVAVSPLQGSVDELARKLRRASSPVFGRVAENSLLLDFRTVLDGEEKIMIRMFGEIFKPG